MRRLAAGLAAAAWLAFGCGPVQTTRAVSLAEQEIAAARAEQADVASPYEFESALLYLDRALAREGRADFEQARDWARRAAAFAAEARAKADENRRLKEVRDRAAARAADAPDPAPVSPHREGDAP
jgi:hypothetical protein